MFGNTAGETPSFAAQRSINEVSKLFPPFKFMIPTSSDFVSWDNVNALEMRLLALILFNYVFN